MIVSPKLPELENGLFESRSSEPLPSRHFWAKARAYHAIEISCKATLLEDCAAELDELAKRSSKLVSSSSPFNRSSAIAAWGKQLVGEPQQIIVALARIAGRLRGALIVTPLNSTELQLWGSNLDYGEWLLEPGEELAVAWSLLAAILAHGQALHTHRIRMNSPLLATLQSLQAERIIELQLDTPLQVPLCLLAETWELFLDSQPSMRRKHLKAEFRRFQKIPALSLEWVDGAQEIPQLLSEFFRLHLLRHGDVSVYRDVRHRAFLEQFLKDAVGRSEAQVLVVRSGKSIVGVMLLLLSENEAYFLNAGWDPGWSWFGVGKGMVQEALRQAIRLRKTRFNFLVGNEDYKYNFSNAEEACVSATITAGVNFLDSVSPTRKNAFRKVTAPQLYSSSALAVEAEGPSLFLFAHADDEILFAFKTIQTRAALGDVHIACVTKPPNEARAAGYLRSCSAFGACIHMGAVYDPGIAAGLDEDETRSAIERLLNIVKPRQIFTHGRWGEYGHPHHKQIWQIMHDINVPFYSIAGLGRSSFRLRLSDDDFRSKLQRFSECYSTEGEVWRLGSSVERWWFQGRSRPPPHAIPAGRERSIWALTPEYAAIMKVPYAEIRSEYGQLLEMAERSSA